MLVQSFVRQVQYSTLCDGDLTANQGTCICCLCHIFCLILIFFFYSNKLSILPSYMELNELWCLKALTLY